MTGCGEDEFYVVIRDISSRKKAEQKLIASEERYRTLVESLPDITIRTDFEGYYLDHHIAEDQFVGKNFREILYYQQKSRKQLWSYYGKKLQKNLLSQWSKLRDRSYQNQTVETFEYSLPDEKGELFWSMRINDENKPRSGDAYPGCFGTPENDSGNTKQRKEVSADGGEIAGSCFHHTLGQS